MNTGLPPNYPESIPLSEHRVVRLSSDLFFAIQELAVSSDCPNGIFSKAVAVDRTSETALTRARYEAAERFALAAILDGHQFQSGKDIDSSDIFEFPVLLSHPLNGYMRNTETSYLEFSESINMRSKYVAAADVFAPYPIIKGECNWHPTTNGVAVEKSYQSAKLASFCEYLERHSIMEYWYNKSTSYKVELSALDAVTSPEVLFLANLGYNLTCIEISALESIFVVLILATNQAGSYPFCVCSAGSGLTLRKALAKAAQETVQTLIACAGQVAEFSGWKDMSGEIHSLDHRMYHFADPAMASAIEGAILRVKTEALDLHERSSSELDFSFDSLTKAGLSAAFVDITPKTWNNKLNCVRCFSSTMLPLLVSESMTQKTPIFSTISRFGMPHPFP